MSRPLRLSMLAGALALLCGSLLAQPYDTPPKPAEPRPLRIAAPTEDSLPNGLRVVVAERRGVPLVTARLLILAGSELDAEKRSGLASMTAGLLTRGTKKRSAPALVSAAEALGGSLDSGAAWHQANVSITVTTPQLSAALGLVTEVVQQPAFAQAELERYRSQALDEMKVRYAEPGTVAAMVAQRALYGAGTYGHPVGGTPASLPRISREDVLKLHAAAYRPDNAVLVLAGDIDLGTGVKLASRHFGAWKKPAGAAPAATAAVGATWPDSTVVVDMPGAGQAGVVMLIPAIAANAPDRMAGMVLNAVLGRGYLSRLSQEIRIKRGLSYDARSMLDTRRDAGAMRVDVQTKNPSAAEVLGLIHTELDALALTPVAAEEMTARKATLIGDYSRTLETTSGLAAQVAGLVVAGLSPGELTQRIARIEAVSPAEVQAFAGKYFERSRRRAVIAGVAKDFEAALRPTSPQLRVLQQDGLDLDSQDALKR